MGLSGGDRVRVIAYKHVDDQTSDEFVGMEGEVVEIYPEPNAFDVSIHIDGAPDNEFQSFDEDELEVIPSHYDRSMNELDGGW